ncbi:hypothetical protein HYC85_023622 [Camellia sinensis]|uniref:Uncharacterized protein n=1 Tax=Camellia sinensis TaxID=4442 RepID=A0A7J7GF27_CAMSI|nr:hypothetical protein HYC85_023622 [Camellia sinensis]
MAPLQSSRSRIVYPLTSLSKLIEYLWFRYVFLTLSKRNKHIYNGALIKRIWR